MKKVYIIYNNDKEIAKEIYFKTLEYLKKRAVIVVSSVSKSDFAIVIGGDGTLLKNFKKFINKKDYPIIGINAGKLGYLTEIKKENIYKEYNNFFNNLSKIEKRNILKVTLKEKIYYSLNEVVISKTGIFSKMIKVRFENKEREHINTYKGDGVLVATPTGSTAYSMSAGGPIINPNLKIMLLTPIAPHNLTTRPIILSGDEILNISLPKDTRKKIIDGRLIIDGQISKKITSEDEIKIEFSKKFISLVVPKDRNYYSVLREKLKWGDNLC